VIAKKFRTYVSSRNLGLSLREVDYSLEKVPFSLGNLGPSSRKIHYSSKKLPFPLRNFFYSIKNLLGTNV
jgi:hypothetical protein